jgi:DNA modification methylase
VADNTLYFGDNLQILRENIRDETIDLIYLDPPFNSKTNYNVLFRSPKGHESDAQITAFEDTWHWGEQAEAEFGELIHQSNTEVSEMIQSLRRFLGENDVMAYLTLMANRLIELRRVLKETGSLYLHCDPTASHYLKIVLDAVFGKENFKNEITWKRTSSHNDAAQGLTRFGRNHDVIFFYTKSQSPAWNIQFMPYDEKYLKQHYSNVEEGTGRRFKTSDLTAAKPGGDTSYEWKGVRPPQGRYWAYSRSNMEKFEAERRLVYADKSGMPRYKHYLDEMPGVSLGDVWDDIPPINSQAKERLGYPTQKPLPLLERIIEASSNEGDVILDPFCGCGTAIHAAQKLKRTWIGIDITHLAISLVEKRLRDAFPGITFNIEGTPKDFDSARDLAQRNKYQFQWWACSLVNAQPYQGKKKGADTGIDGLIYFQDDKTSAKKIIVSVKAGENINVAMIRDLGHVIEREKAAIGLFVTLVEPTRPMKEEAVAMGYYESPSGASFPKLQILTIKALLDGTEQPRYPDLMRGGLMFKKAKQEIADRQDDLFSKG